MRDLCRVTMYYMQPCQLLTLTLGNRGVGIPPSPSGLFLLPGIVPIYITISSGHTEVLLDHEDVDKNMRQFGVADVI